MIPRPLPSADYLRATFDYDASTGDLRWKHREDALPKWNGRFAGKVAGTVVGGRVDLILNGKHFKAHRVIWKMVTGADPAEIDHADGNPLNNRLANLRPATRVENMRNTRGRARSGVKGVGFHPQTGYWRARVKVDGKEICVYRHSLEAAAEAYAELARTHYGAFARLA